MQRCMNDDCHAAFVHTSNCIILCLDMVHVGDSWKFGNGRLWTLRDRSWMRESEEVGLHLSITSGWIYMMENAGGMCWNVVCLCH
jgi:hypothetical protein